jgi:hypothetical protein
MGETGFVKKITEAENQSQTPFKGTQEWEFFGFDFKFCTRNNPTFPHNGPIKIFFLQNLNTLKGVRL